MICRGVATTFGKAFRMLETVKNIKLLPRSNSSVDKVAVAQFNKEQGKQRYNSIGRKKGGKKKAAMYSCVMLIGKISLDPFWFC